MLKNIELCIQRWRLPPYRVDICTINFSQYVCAWNYSIRPGAIFAARKNNGKVVRSAFDHTSWWKLGVTAKGIYILDLMRKSWGCWFFFLSLSVAIIACNRACGCAGCRTQFCSLFVLLITPGKNSAAPVAWCSSHPTFVWIRLTFLQRKYMFILNKAFGLQVNTHVIL